MQLLHKIAKKESKYAQRIQPPPSVTSNDTRQLTSDESQSDYGGSYSALQVPQGFDDEPFPMRTQQPNTFPGYDPNHPMGPFLQLFCDACGIERLNAATISRFKERLRTVPNEDLESDLCYILQIDDQQAKFIVLCMLLEGFQT